MALFDYIYGNENKNRAPAQEEFDPDAYVADTFDPDEFIAENNTQEAEALPMGPGNLPIQNKRLPGMSGRLLYKNLGAGAAGLKYLQKENPDLEWATDESGEPIAKEKGGKEWFRLDPTGFNVTDLPELASDVGDVGYDIGAGTLQGMATTAGMLGGGLPGGMALSGGSGAIFEAVRQGLGMAAGVAEPNLDWGAITTAGTVGAATPMVFGSPATKKQILERTAKQLIKQTGAKETVKDVMKRVASDPEAAQALEVFGTDIFKKQRGLLGRAAVNLSGKIAGVERDTLERGARIMPLIEKAKESPEARNKIYQDFAVSVNDAFDNGFNYLGEKFNTIKNKLDEKVAKSGEHAKWTPHKYLGYGGPSEVLPGKYFNTSEYKEIMRNALAKELKKTASLGSEETLEKAEKQLIKEIGSLPDTMTAEQLHATSQRIFDLAESSGFNIKMGTMSAKQSLVAKKAAPILLETAKKMRSDLEAGVKKVIPDDADTFIQAMDEWSRLKTLQEYLNFPAVYGEGKFNPKAAEAAQKFLRDANTKNVSKQAVNEIKNTLGINVDDLVLTEQALSEFVDKGKDIARSATAAGVGGGAGAGLGYGLSKLLGMQYSYPPMKTGAIIGAGVGGAAGSKQSLSSLMSGYNKIANVPYRLAPAAAEPLNKAMRRAPYMQIMSDVQNAKLKNKQEK